MVVTRSCPLFERNIMSINTYRMQHESGQTYRHTQKLNVTLGSPDGPTHMLSGNDTGLLMVPELTTITLEDVGFFFNQMKYFYFVR